MKITRVKIERFTAFESLDFKASPGINVLIGANGTGKTHLMKVAYAACDISTTKTDFAEKLIRVFLPYEGAPGRLVKRRAVSSQCAVAVFRGKANIRATFSNHVKVPRSVTVRRTRGWIDNPVQSVYIPVKEMLANAPGFRSLYGQREIHFEEVYSDILDRAYRPLLRGPIDQKRKQVLQILKNELDGKVNLKKDEFFFRSKRGNLEFTLLAEGLRKLGLLWLLIQNGTLLKGSILFWDEPETNLNPRLFGPLIEIVLELQRMGVQVFIATHDYAILKELDLRVKKEDKIVFHSLYQDKGSGEIEHHATNTYLSIHPNAIADAFTSLYDREVERTLGM